GGVIRAGSVRDKRGVANSVVAESVSVTSERKGAHSIVEEAKWEAVCEEVIKQERATTHGRVAAGDNVIPQRARPRGSVSDPINVKLKRCSANCGILARPGTAVEGQRSSTNTGVEAGVTG